MWLCTGKWFSPIECKLVPLQLDQVILMVLECPSLLDSLLFPEVPLVQLDLVLLEADLMLSTAAVWSYGRGMILHGEQYIRICYRW